MRSIDLRSKLAVGSAIAFVLATQLACGWLKKEEGTSSGTTTSGGGRGGNADPAVEPGTAPPGDKPGKGCVLPDGAIKADFTVTKGCTTHLKAGLYVRQGATLTIEEGVKVLAATDSYLWVDYGKLVVKGTAKAPVTFMSDNTSPAPGDWVGIGFREKTNAGTIIEHAIIEYAGSKNQGGVGAVHLESMRAGGRISIVDTNITQSAQFGVVADDNATFAKFENNQLTGNKSGSMKVSAEVLGSLGKGNKYVDPIHVPQSRVNDTTAVGPIDVPIFLDGNLDVGAESSVATLTFPEKAVVKMGPQTYISVGSHGAAALVARNVTFTSGSPSPSAGDWVSIFLYPKSSGTVIDGCTFEFGGDKTNSGKGFITFYAQDAKNVKGVTIQNNTFKSSEQGAFGSGDDDCAGFVKNGNKFEGVPACTKP